MRNLLFTILFSLPLCLLGQDVQQADTVTVNSDYEEYERRIERQRVSEICNVPFGCSYAKAKEILENKYGECESESDRTKIIYKKQTYAKVQFDRIMFLFQSDGVNSYMNGCVFIQEAKSLREAEKKMNDLKIILSSKYELTSMVDDNGNAYYTGGVPPKDCNDWYLPAIVIDVLKYDVPDLYKEYMNGYAARLMYGRFDYIKEEF